MWQQDERSRLIQERLEEDLCSREFPPGPALPYSSERFEPEDPNVAVLPKAYKGSDNKQLPGL